MRKTLRWLFAIVLSTILSIVLFLVIITVFAIPIELTRFNSPLGDIASQWLDRPVQIEGSIIVATSLNPAFTLKGLRIQNPQNFDQKDFLLMDEVHLQLSILPLLRKKVHILEFKVHGLSVILEENSQGEVNWIFSPQNNAKAIHTIDETTNSAVKKTDENDTQKKPRTTLLDNDSLVVKLLDLRKIEVAFYRSDKNQPARFILSTCSGAMEVGQPMNIDIKGKAGQFPYSVDVSLASLEEFIRDNKTWVDINLEIAKTTFDLSGHFDLATAARSLTLSTSVKGHDLSDLGELLRLDLPPFAPYRLKTKLYLNKNMAALQEMTITTGASSLNGSARIERADKNIMADIELHSPLVQVDDFVFDDWSWGDTEVVGDQGEVAQDSEPEKAPLTNTQTTDLSEKRKLMDPQVLQRFDCSLRVVSDKVESGKDFLGSGALKVTLQNGRIAIDPLSLSLPGGGIDLAASLKPGDEKSAGSLKVLIENFDIGILARRRQPDSDMGGNVNLNIDLASSANTIPELMASGDGYFDFSGNLTNFKSGIIDLWAVNLISAIISSTKENQSHINCAVGRWTAKNGHLTADTFFIDTSKIRICAKGEVDFTKGDLSIKVTPRAKRAEFFSLATPVKLQGTFSDLNVKLAGGGVLGTAVQMIVSPLSTPLKRLFNNTIPRDGSDVCGMEIGPDNRDNIFVPGCDLEPQ